MTQIMLNFAKKNLFLKSKANNIYIFRIVHTDGRTQRGSRSLKKVDSVLFIMSF